MPVTESRNQNISLTISILDERDNVKGLGWSKRSKVGKASKRWTVIWLELAEMTFHSGPH